MDKINRDEIRGYTKALQNINEIIPSILQDLKSHNKRMTNKLLIELLHCLLKNRQYMRDDIGFVRWVSQKEKFEWFIPERR